MFLQTVCACVKESGERETVTGAWRSTETQQETNQDDNETAREGTEGKYTGRIDRKGNGQEQRRKSVKKKTSQFP